MREQSCESCRFWLSRPAEEDRFEGLCRRCPPTAHTWVSASRGTAETVTMAQFPPMDADSWCGEWQAVGDTGVSLPPGQTAAGMISPPPPDTAAIDGPAWEDDSLAVVEAAAAEGVDPFAAILQSDDTELWEGAAMLGDAPPESTMTDAPDSDDPDTDDDILDFDDRAFAEDAAAEDEAAEATASTTSEELAGAAPPIECAVETAAAEPAAPEAEGAEPRSRSDIVMHIDSAAGPCAADEVALVFSPTGSDHPHRPSEIPDAVEWMTDYPDGPAVAGDPDRSRLPAKAASTESRGEEWPDWSEWLQDFSGAELRLDNVAGPEQALGAPGEATKDAQGVSTEGATKDTAEDAAEDAAENAIAAGAIEESVDDDTDFKPGAPLPDPPPWLNETEKPGLLGWARKAWQ